MFDLWGKETTPFMQAMNFSFGLGCLIVPLIAKPWLLPLEDSTVFLAPANLTTSEPQIRETQLIYPYLIVAGFQLIPAISFFLLFLFKRDTLPHPSRIASTDSSKAKIAPQNPKVKVAVIGLIAIFLHALEGLQVTIGTMLPVYAVKAMHFDKATAAIITSVFWTTFTFFRLFAIFYVDIIGVQLNLFLSLGLVLCSNGLLLPLAFGATSPWLLWAGISLAGIGLSSQWASSFGWTESNFPVTSRIATVFTLANCVGEFDLPFFVGFMIEDYPNVLIWTIFGSTLALITVFSAASYLCRFHLKAKVESFK